ncbi:Na+/H+ antiporter NhaC family protein [Aliikangiella sp. IMCC44632]
MGSTEKKQPTLLDALVPVVGLIIMLVASVQLYESDSSYGANQIALLLAASLAIIVGFRNGYQWKELEAGIVKGISMSLGAILILLMVGSLIGTWILSGTVPTMIFYGLKILDPSYFYAAACITCALVSVCIGSSWTTAGTIGIALVGIAGAMGLSLPMTAGAIISGAYFGDKMSPLSDTTNLAPAVAGTELFTHIRHMAWTTGPSILVAVTLFFIIGLTQDSVDAENNLQATLAIMQSEFAISIFSLIPLFAVLFLAYKKVPAFPTLMIGALLGGVFAAILQPSTVEKMVNSSIYSCSVVSLKTAECEVESTEFTHLRSSASLIINEGAKQHQASIKLPDGDQSQQIEQVIANKNLTVEFERRPYFVNMIDAIWRALASGFSIETGSEVVNDLLNRGGMSSMLNTVWLILCAMTFGAVMETVGLLNRLVSSALKLVRGTGSLVTTVICSCIGINIIAADQYIAIVLPGRMFRAEFKKRKLHPKNLSRVLEDSATITSPLIPWNTCGLYMSSTLGIATLAYLPFCFFNLMNPIVSIIYGITHFKIEKMSETELAELELVEAQSKA